MRVLRLLPDLVVIGLLIVVQLLGSRWLVRRYADRIPPFWQRVILLGSWVAAGNLFVAWLLTFPFLSLLLPSEIRGWIRGVGAMVGMLLFLWLAITTVFVWLRRPGKQVSVPRRMFLQTVQTAVFATPAAAMGYGVFIEREQFRMREQNILIPNLPADLDGLKIAQITDIHMGSFIGAKAVRRAVDMANETRPHLHLVTGDLITMDGDPLDDCLDILAKLKSDAGIYGCLGNHEYYADAEDYTELEGLKRNILFLRNNYAPLIFGGSVLNLAGVDYQRLRRPYLVGAERLRQPNAVNIMLSHNPDVFPVAAKQGYDLTISGHTHGGQVRIEILDKDINVARFYSPYYDGLYRIGEKSIFVSRGIGTIGIPARFGAPPEVALIRLCRT